ncbi:MAG TPA: CBS domain-containing protein [Thermoanaerobaculia bacterium]|nr:CBS domain-containing protein [Thermoanaerobaculia bacterium]
MKRKLCVGDLMVDHVLAVRPGERLSAVRDLMLDHQVRHMPVVEEDGTLMGLISHRDLLRNSLVEQAEVPDYVEKAVLDRLTAREVMIREVETVTPDTDIREAAQLMFENKYGSLPVVEGERLVGILTEADFVRFLARGD